LLTADPQTAALGAIIGICAGVVICVIALIIFVIMFCNFKIKDDTNIRKRLITNDAFDEEKAVVEQSVHCSFTLFPVRQLHWRGITKLQTIHTKAQKLLVRN